MDCGMYFIWKTGDMEASKNMWENMLEKEKIST